MPINVVCLKWGTKYTSQDVNRLAHMVGKNLTVDYNFYCLTDNADGLNQNIQALPLEIDYLQGWWYKLLVFQKNFYNLKGTLLFFDVDVVITSNLDDLLTFEAERSLAICSDWSEPQIHYQGFNSSVFRLKIGSQSQIWETFQTNYKKITYLLHGDQDWLDLAAQDFSYFPKSWIVPYKSAECQSQVKSFGVLGESLRRMGLFKPKHSSIVPKDAKVVIFNGLPDPQNVAEDSYLHWKRANWIKQAWE